jgi:SAM-dependent methyltransferase
MREKKASTNEYSEKNRRMADRCFRNSEYKEASQLYELSIKLNQHNVKALNNLAVLSEELGDSKKAERLYKQACYTPGISATDQLKFFQNLASVQEKNGNLNAALWTYQSATKIKDFAKSHIAFNYLELLQAIHFTSFDPNILASLAILFNVEEIDKDALTKIYLSQLAHKLEISIHQKSTNTTFALDIMESDKIALTMLGNNLVTNHFIERAILDIRNKLLTSILNNNYTKTHRAFLSALKKQCILNKFIYSGEDWELPNIEKLKKNINELPPKILCDAQLIIDSYSEGDTEEASNHVLQPESPTYNLDNTPPTNTASLESKHLIRTFYESNPYPAWTSKPKNTTSTLDQLFENLNLNTAPDDEINILVAGCGTGRHAIQLALTYPNSNIIGLDISLTSLEYATRKRDEYKIRNLEFIHGDLNDACSLGISFCLIECIGVLHHLQDPLKGCQAILTTLCEGGIAKIGLYSSSARTPIAELTSLAADRNTPYIHTNLEKIRKLAIDNYNQGRISEIVNSRDFFSRNGCMDLLFNPMEKTFTVEEIHAFVRALNCDFAGFEKGGQAGSPKFRKFGSDSNIEAFFNDWSRFERSNPAFFSEMYSFWLKPIRN